MPYTYLLFLFLLLHLQIFRNVSIIYMALPIAMYFILFIRYFESQTKKTQLYNFVLFYTIFNFYLIGLTLINSGITDTLIAISRAFFVFPLFFLSHGFIKTEEKLRKIITFYIYIVALGSLSLFYQMFFGAISWFAESSTRGNVPRYASILGSLPTYGVLGSFAIVFSPLLRINSLFKVCLLLIITAGMFLTLQKAAIANLLIAYLILIYIYIRKYKFKTFLVNLSKLIPILLIAYLSTYSLFADYYNIANKFIGLPSDAPVGYVGHDFHEDFNHRLFGGFMGDLDISTIITGMGFSGGGGTMGIEGPMAHNGFGDLLNIGGVFYPFLFCMIFFLAFRKVTYQLRLGMINRDLGLCITGFFILFFINFPFYSGMLINPSLCGTFWVILGYLSFPTMARVSSERPMNSSQ